MSLFFRALFLGALLTALGGCATFAPRVPPPTLGEIVHMSTAKVPPEVIIQRIRDSGGVYPLSAATFAKLHADGVDDRVLNYMQVTYLDEIRREEAFRSNHFHPGFWYGGGHGHHSGGGFFIGF